METRTTNLKVAWGSHFEMQQESNSEIQKLSPGTFEECGAEILSPESKGLANCYTNQLSAAGNPKDLLHCIGLSKPRRKKFMREADKSVELFR